MPRECSIPANLKNSVISRWLNGQSPQSIVEWIHEGNDSRTVPVETSRSSVERLIEYYATAEELPHVLPAARRCQRDAHQILDDLDTVASETWRCFDEADKPDGPPVSRLKVKLRALAQAEKIYMRRLKLAGIDGRRQNVNDLDGEIRSRVRKYDAHLRQQLESENVLLDSESASANSEPAQAAKSVRINDKIAGNTSANDSSIPLVKAARKVEEKLAEKPAKPVSETERKIQATIDAVQARIEQLQEGKKGSG